MRRIVLIIILVAVVGFAGYMLLRPRGSSDDSKSALADTKGTKTKKVRQKRGRTVGRIKPKTKEQLKAERKARRKEERRRKKELKRREREKRRRLKRARKSSRRRSKRRGRKGQAYAVRAIISLGDDSYALVDSRRVGVGDVVMGRRIVAIKPDRLEVEAFGKLTTVRVGESLLPFSYSTKRRRRG